MRDYNEQDPVLASSINSLPIRIPKIGLKDKATETAWVEFQNQLAANCSSKYTLVFVADEMLENTPIDRHGNPLDSNQEGTIEHPTQILERLLGFLRSYDLHPPSLESSIEQGVHQEVKNLSERTRQTAALLFSTKLFESFSMGTGPYTKERYETVADFRMYCDRFSGWLQEAMRSDEFAELIVQRHKNSSL